MELYEQDKGTTKKKKGPKGIVGALGAAASMPITALVGAGVDKEGRGPFKRLMAQGGKILGAGSKIVKTAYALAVAPRKVQKEMVRYIGHVGRGNLQIRLVNLWLLIYPDEHEPEDKVNVIHYASNGIKLLQTTVSKKEIEPYITKTIAKEKTEPEVEDLDISDTLDVIEEEILNEAFGLPPAAALLAKVRFKYQFKKDPKMQELVQLVRYRVWVIRVFDTSRNKTYVNVYDGIHAEKDQPVDQFWYEGPPADRPGGAK